MNTVENTGTERFLNDSVRSNFMYPHSYKIKGIATQVSILQDIFQDLGFADEDMANQSLPLNTEGWFAIPRWDKVASTYNEAVEKVLKLVAHRLKLQNCCEGSLGSRYLRQCSQTAKMFQRLGDQQKGYDILVVPAQFGFKYRGYSVESVRNNLEDNEFPLGVFAVACMLLTHPKREIQDNQLHVDCAGDEYCSIGMCSLGNDDHFNLSALSFNFNYNRHAHELGGRYMYAHGGGTIRLSSRLCKNADSRHGSASAFLLE
ncbi:MAG: hypothetical protein WCW87_01945 [Candidatus Paceibacterota bacterium]